MRRGRYLAVSVAMVFALMVLGGCLMKREIPPSILEGVTQDLDGNPLGGVTISGPNGIEVSSDDNGKFSMEVVPGNVVLTAQKGIWNGKLVLTVKTGESYTDLVFPLKDYWTLLEFDGTDAGSVEDNWRKQPGTVNSNTVCGVNVDTDNGIATFWYNDRPDTRDIASVALSHLEWPAGLYNKIAVKFRVNQNARVGFEIFWSESEVVRIGQNYYPGNGSGDWEIWTLDIPAGKGYMRLFQVGVGEENSTDSEKINFGGATLEVDVDWVRLYYEE